MAGPNLLHNSSFEVPGNNFWGFSGSKFTEDDLAPEAVHGAYSLRWPYVNPFLEWPYYEPTTGVYQSMLVYHPVTAVAGQEYTVSAWVKTDADSQLDGTVQFVIRDSERGPFRILAQSPVYPLTRDWQRYSFTTNLPAAQSNQYVVQLLFFGDPPQTSPYPIPPRAHGVVDAVQFEQGPLSDYQATHTVEYGLFPEADANAWTWGENIVIDLYACNTTTTSLSKTVRWWVEDFYGRTVRSNSLTLNLPPTNRIKTAVSLGTNLRGHFRMLLEDDSVIRTEKVFSSIPPAKDIAPSNSIYGVDATLSEFVLNQARRLGIRWIRPHTDLSWEAIEPQQDQFIFPDYRVGLAFAKGLSVYGLLYRTPPWARPPGGTEQSMPTNLVTWSNFVYRTVAHFHNHGVEHWEIYNEPHFRISSTQYLALVQQAYGAAKAATPQAQIFGWSGQVSSPTNYHYSDVSSNLIQYFDLISAHYYPEYVGVAGRRLYDLLLSHREIVATNRLPLWNTEGGATGGGTFYRTKGDFVLNDDRNSHTATTAKMWTIHKAAGVRLFWYWMTFPTADHMPGWSWSWTLNEYDSGLKAAAVATAASAYFLDGTNVSFQGILYDGAVSNKVVTAYTFKRGINDHIVVAWLDATNRAVFVENPAVPAATKVYDMFGRVLHSVQPGGRLEFLLRIEPVYIEVTGHSDPVDRDFLKLGHVLPDNGIEIDTTLVPQGNPSRARIFAGPQNPPGQTELIYQTTVTQPTDLFLSWGAPVTQPDPDTLVLFHMDNRAEYEETTNHIHDFSGSGRHGSILASGNGQRLQYGDSFGHLAGGFRSLGGRTNYAIVVTNSSAFNGLDQFTVSMWLRLEPPTAANRLFALGNVSGFAPGDAAISARVRESGSELIFQVADALSQRSRQSSVPFPKGDSIYHHVCFVFDGRPADPAARRLDIYIDGQKVNGTLSTGTIPSATRLVNAEDLYIVGYAAGGPTEAITGELDEFVFEKRALSDSEVKARAALTPGATYHWIVEITGTNTVTSTVTTDQASTHDPLTYQISAATQNGSVLLTPQREAYLPGEAVSVLAIPDSGFIFSNWTGSVNATTNPLSLTITSDLDLLALTTSTVTYQLNVTAENGSVTIDPLLTGYTPGQPVTLTAVPASGYEFTGWSGDATGTQNPLTISMTSNKSIQAVFSIAEPLRILSITRVAGGFHIVWNSQPGSTYTLEIRNSPTGPVTSSIPGLTGPEYVITNSSAVSGQFIRLRKE